jgi:uncharacterized protein with LGFP repeats
MPDDKQGGGFWSTLPGVLSGTAALITAAIGGLVLLRDKSTADDATPPPMAIAAVVVPGTAEIAQAAATLGAAVAQAFSVAGGGRQQNFEKGSVIWHPDTGAIALFGAINQKYQAIGGPLFGYPIMSETMTPDGIGRFVHLRHRYPNGFVEDRSIYWRPELGAQSTQGLVRLKWAEQGWERGPLGYPTSDEYTASDGMRRQDFQHGHIVWSPQTGAIIRQ